MGESVRMRVGGLVVQRAWRLSKRAEHVSQHAWRLSRRAEHVTKRDWKCGAGAVCRGKVLGRGGGEGL